MTKKAENYIHANTCFNTHTDNLCCSARVLPLSLSFSFPVPVYVSDPLLPSFKMSPPANESALRHLITTYYELNGSVIEELDSEPSPLEFMRYVSRNTPFVIRGGASSWKATRQWNAAYLKKALAAQCVNVAVTPHGSVSPPSICHGPSSNSHQHHTSQQRRCTHLLTRARCHCPVKASRGIPALR